MKAMSYLFINRLTYFQSLNNSRIMLKVVNRSYESAFSKFITLVRYLAPGALMFLIYY